jgi:CheY-like chemotaxis protein
MQPVSNKFAADSTTLPKEGVRILSGLEENRADLVLMDIQLDGGISGIAAAAAIRGHLDIPVVFLTAHASAETVGRANKHSTEIAMRRALSSRLPADVAQPQSI